MASVPPVQARTTAYGSSSRSCRRHGGFPMRSMESGTAHMHCVGLAGTRFLFAFVLLITAAMRGDAPLAGQRASAVDLELVLAVDVSASISASEQRLQRLGYVDAFRSPE